MPALVSLRQLRSTSQVIAGKLLLARKPNSIGFDVFAELQMQLEHC